MSSQLRCSCAGPWWDAERGAAVRGLPGAAGPPASQAAAGLQLQHFTESLVSWWLGTGHAELLGHG